MIKRQYCSLKRSAVLNKTAWIKIKEEAKKQIRKKLIQLSFFPCQAIGRVSMGMQKAKRRRTLMRRFVICLTFV